MPDGNTTDQPAGTEPPPPPDDQIHIEIATGRVVEWLGGLFGTDWETTAGGGGTGGRFMFASIADLDSVIAQWKEQRDAILVDGGRIRQAIGHIIPPADDSMSIGQADSTTRSLDALYQHNRAMLEYANDYIGKLEDSRAEMVNLDHGGQAAMNSLNQGPGQ